MPEIGAEEGNQHDGARSSGCSSSRWASNDPRLRMVRFRPRHRSAAFNEPDESPVVAAQFDDEDRRHRDRELDRDDFRLIQAGVRTEIVIVGMCARPDPVKIDSAVVEADNELRRTSRSDQSIGIELSLPSPRRCWPGPLYCNCRARTRSGRCSSRMLPRRDALAAAIDVDAQFRNLLQVRAHGGQSDIPPGPPYGFQGAASPFGRRPSRLILR